MRNHFPIYNLAKSIIPASRRYNRWGSNRYRGNCDGRLFADLILRYGAKSVADPMIGSGTTADCVRDLNAHGAGIQYWGGDLNQGFNLVTDDIPGMFDFVWIHPPYWNLIRYSQRETDLSNAPTYEVFLEQLTVCLERCYAALNPGGRLAVLVGDMHWKGKFITLTRDVQNLEGRVGQIRAIIVKAMANCWSDINASPHRGTLPLDGIKVRHETCIVFRKPKL